jgi:UDP-N-acetylglucosamine 2-epimerase (non-hydrolysing)
MFEMKIISVVGARPNFMKIAPFIRAVEAYNKTNAAGIEHLLVHTGQHYDDKMSRAFFKALDIPDADINLDVGSGSHAQQVGQTMMAFEKVVQAEKPDWVVVVGDVNATLACSVTAKKEWVKCCHIEAGLRSGDMTMPEEVNRLVTDRLSDLLLTPDLLSSENLRKEGVAEEKIKFVGNIMIDTLEAQRSKAEKLSIQEIIQGNSIPEQPAPSPIIAPHSRPTGPHSPLYALMTLHRPSNVDHPDVFTGIFNFLATEVAEDMPLFWPVHPRARQKMEEFGLWQRALACPGLVLLEPLGYHEMLRLNMDARIMLTDSGGLQEECTVLGTPCLTLRWNTERPVTLREHGGASVLVGNNVDRIREEYKNTLSSERRPVRPELWDGKAAERCLKAILEY